MRILYLTDRLSLMGGADLHLRDVIDAAMAAGHRVSLAHGGQHHRTAPPPNVTAVRLRSLASAVADGRQVDRLGALVAAADVVHLQNVVNPIAIETAVASARALVTVQDHRFFCPGRGKWTVEKLPCTEPMSLASCAGCFDDQAYRERLVALTEHRRRALHDARLVVLSRYMARELAQVGLPAAEVVPPWVSPSDDQATADDSIAPFVLAGRLVDHKGVLDAVRAWQLSGVRRPLLVAGGGRLAGRLGAELGAGAMLGWLSRAALRRQLATARALLFPAGWQEPFGIVAVEALAEGAPVIVMQSGGTDEWSASGGCVVVAPGDLEATAAAIRALDRDAARAHEMGAAGRVFVRQRFARDRLWPRLERLYREVASGARRGRPGWSDR